ncbi:hypothetical protein HGRIS_011454 [Hohenbuehelia grisea]|uniref:RING-type domain-containing protein n=1 Tax=Hohenbuehelia grisea TaxID=104357 RepID=A0ABR3JV37_9AGAR
MVKIECSICFDAFTTDQFRFLRCGHGFCVQCTDHLAMHNSCVLCKAPKRRGDAHPIFASFVLSESEEKAAQVTEGLRKIDANSSSSTVKASVQQLRDFLASNHTKKDLAQMLSVVADGLEERVSPLCSRVEELSGENEALKAKNKAVLLAYRKSLARVEEENGALRAAAARWEAVATLAQDRLHAQAISQQQPASTK